MKRHPLAGLIIIAVGLSILFSFHFFSFIMGIIVLWIGVKILTGHNRRFGDFAYDVRGMLNEDYLKRVLVFSGINTKLKTENFEGMELVVVFGGGEIDASQVKTKKTNVDIDLVAILGGVKVRIPKGWAVKSEGMGMLGGFDNRTEVSGKPLVTVHLKGVAILGGVEVVN